MNLHKFFRCVLPAVLGMVGLSCYILIDTLFVSVALGASGLAALNLSISVFSIISGIGQLAGVGGGTDFSLRRAEGKDVSSSCFHALVFASVSSAFFFLLGLFAAGSISKLLGADAATFDMTCTYVRMTLLFAPAYIFNAMLQGFVRNDNAPTLAMASMLTSSIANIILDYLFMFPLGMGMFGAVLATGLSAVFSILLLLAHFCRKNCSLRFVPCRISMHRLSGLLSYGLSAMIGELASAISLLTLNLILMQIAGYVAVAAYGVIANAALVATAIFTGVGQGVQPLSSHAFGCSDSSMLCLVRRYALLTAAFLSVLIAAVVALLAPPIAAAFNHGHDLQLQAIAVPGLRLYFAGYLFAGVNIVASAYLSATERPGSALVLSLLRSCVLLIPAALLLSRLLGLTGVWLSFCAAESTAFVLALITLQRSKQPE